MSSSPSSSSSITNSSSSIPTMTPISHIVSIKLTPDNYPLWKAQLLHYFRGQDLYGYLDGTVTLPPQTIDALHPDTGAVNNIPNPAHSQWLRQDSLILSTLMSSMTEGVLAQIVSHATSHEVWRALETKFSSQSRARTIQVRTQLANAKKGNQSANDYFLSIKKLADELAMAGQPLKCDDIISYVLAGLGHEYDSFVSSIYARTDHVTLEEVYSLLIVTESRINRHHLSTPAPLAEANIVQRQSQQSNNRGRGGSRGTDEGTPIRHANSVSSQAIVAAEHPLSSSISAEPPQPTTDPTVTQGNTRTHAMVTRSRNNIFKPKATPDDVVRSSVAISVVLQLYKRATM
ncbi:hypothetical protein F0562_025251 [Nyssa sinensis]|uniref:Uncharacterized protein n=1 Tax=Nyssa sinensis TaxID=561372 RepID=A0A5J5BF64_9ASTE|nr:hypothetical protein F0562_025251 [Nyssa sinensis]